MASKGRLGLHVALQRQDVDASRVVDAAGAVCDSNDLAAIEREQLCCPAAHVAEALGRPAQSHSQIVQW